jgi:hypothetical protein
LGCARPCWLCAAVKELSDNALDAAEQMGVAPEVATAIESTTITEKGNQMASFAADPAAAALDMQPSPAQRRVLNSLAAGYELALGPDGRPVLRQTGESVPFATVEALIRRQWIDRRPGLPLFAAAVAITAHSRRALSL